MKKFFESKIGKVIKAGAYVAVSTLISFLITATAEDPELFGALTIFINMLLVFIAKSLPQKVTS